MSASAADGGGDGDEEMTARERRREARELKARDWKDFLSFFAIWFFRGLMEDSDGCVHVCVQGEGATAWMTVSMFGDWDMKYDAMPNYSMDFSKIWEMHKQNKKELSRASLRGDDDPLAHHK
ncbi:hypothetical protein ZWY2020_016816 [Hordeum vulgare]|nr:hypothetical protein ZWY2020_016816 [Hordeum vulgare]